MKRTLTMMFALALAVLCVAPGSFFVPAPRAHAETVTVVGGPGTTAEHGILNKTTIDAIKNTISAAANVAQQASLQALVIHKYVLSPLAFIVSGNLLKSITSSVLGFVNGKTNGTGSPQFVQNVLGHFQTVGDNQAFPFLSQFASNSNSPFASAISSSLRTQYLQQSSLSGFFAANQCTLNQYSPNINSYLSGDWSQGGISAWFALTTQSQNNPYMLYQKTDQELNTLIAGAVGARTLELNWGQGFLSWCGGSSSSGSSAASSPSALAGDTGTSICTTANSTSGTALSTAAGTASAPIGSAAGDACTKKDGSPGLIQTPGSVIKPYLDKILGSNIDKLTGVGDIAAEINSIMSSIGTVFNEVNFATQILGGANSGGLAGVFDSSSSGGSSPISQYEDSSYLGIGQGTVYENSNNSNTAGAQDLLSRVNDYRSAWNTIFTVANATAAALTDLSASCSDQAGAAQAALSGEVNPVFAQYAAASTTIANALALIQKTQQDAAIASSTTNNTAANTAYLADLQALQSAAPTISDVANAEQDTTTLQDAVAHPSGSLNVTATTLVDKLNLITDNAKSIKTACLAAQNNTTNPVDTTSAINTTTATPYIPIFALSDFFEDAPYTTENTETGDFLNALSQSLVFSSSYKSPIAVAPETIASSPSRTFTNGLELKNVSGMVLGSYAQATLTSSCADTVTKTGTYSAGITAFKGLMQSCGIEAAAAHLDYTGWKDFTTGTSIAVNIAPAVGLSLEAVKQAAAGRNLISQDYGVIHLVHSHPAQNGFAYNPPSVLDIYACAADLAEAMSVSSSFSSRIIWPVVTPEGVYTIDCTNLAAAHTKPFSPIGSGWTQADETRFEESVKIPIEKEIRTGSMAVADLVKSYTLERTYALKLIPSSTLQNELVKAGGGDFQAAQQVDVLAKDPGNFTAATPAQEQQAYQQYLQYWKSRGVTISLQS